ncbi:MAG: hypothetical protein ABJO05_09530, partial [Roseibium sp.]
MTRIKRAVHGRVIYPAFRKMHRFVVYRQNTWLPDILEPLVRFSALTGNQVFVDQWADNLRRMGLRQRQIEFLDWAAENVDESKYKTRAVLARAASGELDSRELGEIVRLGSGASNNFYDYLSLLKLDLATYAESHNQDIFGFGEQKSHSEDIASRAYRLMWLAHQVNNGAKVDHYARTYARLTSYELPSIRNIIVNVAAPSGRHHLAIELLDQTEARLKEAKARKSRRASGEPRSKSVPSIEEIDSQLRELHTIRNQALYELGLPLDRSVQRVS